MMMGWDMGWTWGGMLFGTLMMILFWGGLVALVVVAVRALAGSSSQSNRHSESAPKQPTPLEILQSRYAKGELGDEEYERMRQTLQRS